MLTPAEKQILEENCRTVFRQIDGLDDYATLTAAVRLSMAAVEAILELQESLLYVPDDASCGPTPLPAPRPADVRGGCPHS